MYINETPKSRFFLDLKPGDNIFIYRPKVIPESELESLKLIFPSYPIDKAVYAKLSITQADEIIDYHLISLLVKAEFYIDDFLNNKVFYRMEFKDFKFLDLTTNHSLKNKLINMGFVFYTCFNEYSR